MRSRATSLRRYRARIASARLLLSGALLTMAMGTITLPALAAEVDPELRARLQQAVASSNSFADEYDATVWYATSPDGRKSIAPVHSATA